MTGHMMRLLTVASMTANAPLISTPGHPLLFFYVLRILYTLTSEYFHYTLGIAYEDPI